jgi:hypothetical protein
MLRQTVLPLCLLVALAFGAAAHAGDGPPPPHDDQDRGPPVPFAGYDVGYDYVIAHDHVDVDPYYNYQGPPPTDRRAHEQLGLRHGDLPIKPLTPYDDGVTTYGDDDGYGYGSGYGYGYSYGYGVSDDDCGCAHYPRRYNVYYDDFGNRGASYSGYDYRRHEDYGRGYGD